MEEHNEVIVRMEINFTNSQYDSFAHFTLISLFPWASEKAEIWKRVIMLGSQHQCEGQQTPRPNQGHQMYVCIYHMQTHQRQDQVSSSTHQESPGQLPPPRLCYTAGARCCAAFLLNPATSCFGQGVWSTRAHGALQWSGGLGSPCQLHIWPCIIKRDVRATYTVFLIGVGDTFIGLLARMSGTGETVGSAPKWC